MQLTNHVHLLLAPGEAGAGCIADDAGHRPTLCRRIQYRYGRTGTLWEGRFKAAMVDSDRYLLTCYRYIELNPVRARMVVHPREYRWSSHHCNADGPDEARIAPHHCYLALGANPTERRETYRLLFDESLPSVEMDALCAHTHQQRAFGSAHFQSQIEALTHRAATLKPRGRPAKGIK